MIHDRLLEVFELAPSSSPLERKLQNGLEYYYGEKEVYASRYFSASQTGETINMLVEIPRLIEEDRIPTDRYCIPEDGKVYKIIQAQYGNDENFLPVTTLSLKAMEEKYEILRP